MELNTQPFWQAKTLDDMSPEEWESLCDQCGKCCIQSCKSPEAPSKPTISLCHNLNVLNSTCSVYSMRDQLVPDCPVLTAENTDLIARMPETCSYRLLQESKPLPDWHPLVSGNPDSAKNHKIIIRGKLAIEPPKAAPREAEIVEAEEPNTKLLADSTIEIFTKALGTTDKTSLTGKLLASTSHDIRTALNSIVGIAQLMSDTNLTPEQNSYVTSIHQSTQTLFKTINYVLDISRIEAGKTGLSETAIDLYALSRKMNIAFKPMAKNKAIELSCECNDSVPLSVMCDQGLLERVLTTLLHNALENTEKGTIQFKIKCLSKNQQGAKHVISITDTGTEIAEELKQVILSGSTPADATFAQIDHSKVMDLIISRHIIEAMGGTLQITNNQGQGTTVTIHQTFRQASKPASIQLAKVDRLKTCRKPNLKILLAEDNKVNQKITSTILSKAGCKIDSVDNGVDAVRYMETTAYDLVVMDCQMPIMDGYEATRKIRKLKNERRLVPIIALTANAMAEDRQKCMDNGMTAYLSKPVDRQDLIDLVNKHTVD